MILTERASGEAGAVETVDCTITASRKSSDSPCAEVCSFNITVYASISEVANITLLSWREQSISTDRTAESWVDLREASRTLNASCYCGACSTVGNLRTVKSEDTYTVVVQLVAIAAGATWCCIIAAIAVRDAGRTSVITSKIVAHIARSAVFAIQDAGLAVGITRSGVEWTWFVVSWFWVASIGDRVEDTSVWVTGRASLVGDTLETVIGRGSTGLAELIRVAFIV